MKIATYNIWNNDTLFEERVKATYKTLKEANADIVCLQEVRNEECRDIIEIIANKVNYPFFIFEKYPDCPDEGLAILSKFPFSDTSAIWETDTEISNYCAIRARINYRDSFIAITNVHLNWRSSEIRKEQLKAITNWISSKKEFNMYEVMCGDFNDVPQSTVHNYLTDCGWYDSVDIGSEKDISYYATFDLINNEYLKKDTRKKEKLRFDWIMIKAINNSNQCNQITIESVDIFGNNSINVVPSDHYGIYVVIK